MKKFYKWFKDNRPKVLYRFWLVLMFINLIDAIFLAWAGNVYSVSVTGELWYSMIMAFICLGMTYLWRYYLENPEKYEELQKRRLGRTRRSSKSEDEKKQTPKE